MRKAAPIVRGPAAHKETGLLFDAKRSGALVLRLMVGLALLGCARMGAAQGTWSVISVPQQPGEVLYPSAVAADAAGNLYVADILDRNTGSSRIQRRDAQGDWFVTAPPGKAVGQVQEPAALAVDTAGNLYVAEYDVNRIQKRDAQGNWAVLAASGSGPGQVYVPKALAVDAAGNLYVSDASYGGRVQQRDDQGSWWVIAPASAAALAVDAAGSLYAAVGGGVWKRDAHGNWSGIDTGLGLGYATALAVDTAGNLYVGDEYGIQKRDADGNWSVVATIGKALGEVNGPFGLAVDSAGNLYVADTGNNRVVKYTPAP